MDLQTRKLNIIEYLIKLKDERIFSLIEDLIKKSDSEYNELLKPLTKEDLINRAKMSGKQYSEGKYISQKALEEESKKW